MPLSVVFLSRASPRCPCLQPTTVARSNRRLRPAPLPGVWASPTGAIPRAPSATVTPRASTGSRCARGSHRATVQPCVYWPGGGAPLDILLHADPDVVATKSFVDARSVPQAYAGCSHLAACGGGCAGRRRLIRCARRARPPFARSCARTSAGSPFRSARDAKARECSTTIVRPARP